MPDDSTFEDYERLNLSIKTKDKKARRSSHVPNQHLGYSLQTTRFLALLLDADPGAIVSLEVFEDVGLESTDGHKRAQQVKSTMGHNPIADRAVDLWKTLSNWIDAISQNELVPEKTSFEIYVSSNKTGAIVTSFAQANTIKAAADALSNARAQIYSPDMSQTLRPYAENFFTADEKIAQILIKNFSFHCGSGSPIEDLKSQMSTKFIPPDLVDDTFGYASGWVKQKTDLLLENKRPASISYDEFKSAILSFIRKHDNRTILSSFAGTPSQKEIDANLKIKTYVRQLELIQSDYDKKFRAVNDYLRASIDRTKWSELGLVNEASFDNFEDDLTRTWDNLKTKLFIAHSHEDDINKGKMLYAECSLHNTRLEGLELPGHFTAGSFHALSDVLKIGWHPKYHQEINKLKGVVEE